MLRWFMLHGSLMKSGNSSPPRWKNGRNTWRVSQSPRTGTGNLFGVAGVFGWMSWWDHKIHRSSPKKSFSLAYSRKDMCGPGPVRNERLFEKDNPTKLKSSLRPTSWGWGRPEFLFILWILIHHAILWVVWLIQHAMGLSFELQMPPKSYSKLKRI